MITRRKFLSFLAAVLPAAWVSIEPMRQQADKFKLIPYHDIIILDQRRRPGRYRPGRYSESDKDLWKDQQMGSWETTVRERFSHIDDAYRYMVGARRPKFDNKNYGTIAYTARFQRELNMRRSKVLDIISRKA